VIAAAHARFAATIAFFIDRRTPRAASGFARLTQIYSPGRFFKGKGKKKSKILWFAFAQSDRIRIAGFVSEDRIRIPGQDSH
jgi:hypothetical protein